MSTPKTPPFSRWCRPPFSPPAAPRFTFSSIGDHGHAAGPLIGLWDLQAGVPGRGDVRLLAGTWWSIELQATTAVAEWGGQKLQVALEEDAVLPEQGGNRARMDWVLKNQTEYHLVK